VLRQVFAGSPQLLVPHRKKTGAQQAYVKFITRIGSHPKTLFTEFGGQIWFSTMSPLPLSMSLPRPFLRRLTVNLQTTMLFLRLGAMLPGSSRNSIARISGLISRTSRGSDALDAATDNAALDDAVEVDLQDSSSAPNPPSDADNAVSSDDNDARKALLSELL
jgi:hypothetical protein